MATVILLIGALICSAMLIGTSWRALDAAGQASLNQAGVTIDAQIRMLTNIGQIMKENSKISIAAVTSAPLDYGTFLNMQEYSFLLDILQDMLLCYDAPQTEGYIYSPKGIYRKDYFDQSYNGFGVQTSYINEWMHSITKPSWVVSEDISGNSTLVYAYPLTMGKGKISRAVFFVIKSDRLFQLLTDSFGDDLISASATVFGGKTLRFQNNTCTVAEQPGHSNYSALSSNSNLIFRVHTGQRYKLFPLTVLHAIIVALSICLVGVITLLIVKLAKRTSRPIVHLANEMESGKQTDASLSKYEELDSIRRAYRRVHQENKRLEGNYSRQSQLLRSNLLLNMIHGKLENVNAEYLHSAMGLKEEHTVYSLVMVILDKSEQDPDTE
ncbi:MAG: hypothetical protein K6G61_02645, partial [Solobacterium sp.]|nr:hypothetical protein [Solobacterium sp.]